MNFLLFIFCLLYSSAQQWSSHSILSTKISSKVQNNPIRFQENVLVPNYTTVRKKPLDKSKLKYIEIGGLFPMNGNEGNTGWLGGQGCLPAAMMALEDVNNNEELLSGYYLNITWNNSQVSWL